MSTNLGVWLIGVVIVLAICAVHYVLLREKGLLRQVNDLRERVDSLRLINDRVEVLEYRARNAERYPERYSPPPTRDVKGRETG